MIYILMLLRDSYDDDSTDFPILANHDRSVVEKRMAELQSKMEFAPKELRDC
jgi:hypothetical protein